MTALQTLQRALDRSVDLSAEDKQRAQQYLDTMRDWHSIHTRVPARVQVLVTRNKDQKAWCMSHDLFSGIDLEINDVSQHVAYRVQEMLTEALKDSGT